MRDTVNVAKPSPGSKLWRKTLDNQQCAKEDDGPLTHKNVSVPQEGLPAYQTVVHKDSFR